MAARADGVTVVSQFGLKDPPRSSAARSVLSQRCPRRRRESVEVAPASLKPPPVFWSAGRAAWRARVVSTNQPVRLSHLPHCRATETLFVDYTTLLRAPESALRHAAESAFLRRACHRMSVSEQSTCLSSETAALFGGALLRPRSAVPLRASEIGF